MCNCSSGFDPGLKCHQFHQELVYAYSNEDGDIVPYTNCSLLPLKKFVPFHDPFIFVDCPSHC
jgi:hypothetical protein